MRVLCLSTEFPPGPGGIGAHALNVATQLHRHGARVSVMSPQDYVQPAEIAAFNARQPFSVHQLPHVPGPALQGVWWAAALHRACRRHGVQILLATGQRAVWLAAAYGATRSLPFVAVGHGTEFGTRRRWQRWLNQRSYPRASLVISVSEFTRRFMIAQGLEPRRDTVIPNGADGDFFRPPSDEEIRDLRRRFPIAEKPLLVTVGTLSERKGQDLVIRALPEILAHHPDVQYVAIGMDHAAGQLRELAQELGVAKHFHCPGRLDAADVRTFLGAAELFVLPSRVTVGGDVEGFGIAVVEAALCGTPAVVSQAGGLVEAIADGDTGLAVPSENPAALAQAITSLLLDENQRQTMARKALQRSTQEQTWERRGEDYDHAIRCLLSEC